MDIEEEIIARMPKWVAVILVTLFIVFAFWVVVGGYMHGQVRNTNPRYTIGYVTGTDYVIGPSSHSVAFFTYSVGDSTYRQSADGDLPAGCTRCLVRFAATDPTNAEFFNQTCLPDELPPPPPQGWTAPPVPLP